MRRSWLALIVLLGVAGFLVLASAAGPSDSPEHRSDSDGRQGTSALFQYLQARGHQTRAFTDGFQIDARTGLLFVFEPRSDFSADELIQLENWVGGGGVLVYASTTETRVDEEFGLRRLQRAVSGRGHGAGPYLPGVERVDGSQYLAPFAPQPAQVVLLRAQTGEALAVSLKSGSGRVVALADPLELCNGYITDVDNWRLAADLAALAPAGSDAVFDEYHHLVAAGSGALLPYSVFQFAWAQGVGLAAAIIFAGLVLRGRAFGSRIPIDPDSGRPGEEYVAAVGALLRRAGARGLALELMLGATRSALMRRAGIARGGPAGEDALKSRAPELAARLAEVEQDLGTAQLSDENLLAAARRLHDLARPLPGAPRS